MNLIVCSLSSSIIRFVAWFRVCLAGMALKRGLSGVNRIRGGGGGGGGGSRSAFILLVFFCVFAPLVFFVGRGVYIDSSNGIALFARCVTLKIWLCFCFIRFLWICNSFIWHESFTFVGADYSNDSVKQVSWKLLFILSSLCFDRSKWCCLIGWLFAGSWLERTFSYEIS